ncbi:PstS family phosphate ABC transporter substrate-binding protein [bacterium]|nr:MAG: PstS family phosphate ABC transporter substrate-binding protein [bacterium]
MKKLLIAFLFISIQIQVQAQIKIDGSSTVYPLTDAIATYYTRSNSNAAFDIQFSGTGGGFKKFAMGNTVINNSSRKPKDSEIQLMNENGIQFIEIPLAQDGIAVVVHKENRFVNELSLDELRSIWKKDSKVVYWSDLRSTWPYKKINLYGPGMSSGTRDFFAEVLFGDTKLMRTDYEMSEDDDELEKDIETDSFGLSFFGVAYVKKNENKVSVVGITDGKEVEMPSIKAIQTRSYPLTRTLYLHVNRDAVRSDSQLVQFLNFYMKSVTNMSKAAGYIPLDARLYKKSLDEINSISTASLGK